MSLQPFFPVLVRRPGRSASFMKLTKLGYSNTSPEYGPKEKNFTPYPWYFFFFFFFLPGFPQWPCSPSVVYGRDGARWFPFHRRFPHPGNSLLTPLAPLLLYCFVHPNAPPFYDSFCVPRQAAIFSRALSPLFFLFPLPFFFFPTDPQNSLPPSTPRTDNFPPRQTLFPSLFPGVVFFLDLVYVFEVISTWF